MTHASLWPAVRHIVFSGLLVNSGGLVGCSSESFRGSNGHSSAKSATPASAATPSGNDAILAGDQQSISNSVGSDRSATISGTAETDTRVDPGASLAKSSATATVAGTDVGTAASGACSGDNLGAVVRDSSCYRGFRLCILANSQPTLSCVNFDGIVIQGATPEQIGLFVPGSPCTSGVYVGSTPPAASNITAEMRCLPVGGAKLNTVNNSSTKLGTIAKANPQDCAAGVSVVARDDINLQQFVARCVNDLLVP